MIDVLGEPHPAFELGLRWLTERAPDLPPTEPALVHGDFRTGNFIVGPEGLRAVLDWELAHLGDPVEDLGWFCVKSWRFANVDAARRAGSAPPTSSWLRTPVPGGAVVTPEHLHFWEVFGTLKWGVICEMQTFSHLNGLVRSVELAALGRRVAEQEWDLLALVDPDAPTTLDAPGEGTAEGTATPADTVHDRPTLPELVGVGPRVPRARRDGGRGSGRLPRAGRRPGARHGRARAGARARARRGPSTSDCVALLGRDGSIRDLTVELARRIRTGEIAAGDRADAATRCARRYGAKLAVADPDVRRAPDAATD